MTKTRLQSPDCYKPGASAIKSTNVKDLKARTQLLASINSIVPISCHCFIVVAIAIQTRTSSSAHKDPRLSLGPPQTEKKFKNAHYSYCEKILLTPVVNPLDGDLRKDVINLLKSSCNRPFLLNCMNVMIVIYSILCPSQSVKL